jgi:hypothetical protein
MIFHLLPTNFFFMYLFAAVLYTAQGNMPVDASEKSDVSQEAGGA